MSFRYPKGGFITAFYDPLQVPNAPTSVSATGGDAEATVTFTAPANVGGSAITGYVAQSVPGGLTATGSASPLTVTGLSNGTAYTINVAAINSYGPGPYGTSGSVTPAAPRGVFGGGEDNSASPKPQNYIDYITISTTGNATDFGDLSSVAYGLAGCSSSTRGLFGGLNTGSVTNIIEYITIATTGNSTDFGDLTVARYYLASLSSSTRGVWAGGYTSGGYLAGNQNVIDYVTIASTGNATDFGDLGVGGVYQPAGCASPTRGLIGCGLDTSGTVISTQYITIASTGNSLTFGTLSVSRDNAGACSSSTRGLFGGGGIYSNVIDYYTIASTGNATDFGDLTVARNSLAGTSSSTRGVFGGGYTGSDSNVIDYVTIASTGNATDFGDLTNKRSNLAACSSAHGGL